MIHFKLFFAKEVSFGSRLSFLSFFFAYKCSRASTPFLLRILASFVELLLDFVKDWLAVLAWVCF